MACLVQLLKAVHQVSLDNGSWMDASLLLPVPDPIFKVEFGAEEEELEGIAAHREALAKLKKARAAVSGGGGKDKEDA